MNSSAKLKGTTNAPSWLNSRRARPLRYREIPEYANSHGAVHPEIEPGYNRAVAVEYFTPATCCDSFTSYDADWQAYKEGVTTGDNPSQTALPES